PRPVSAQNTRPEAASTRLLRRTIQIIEMPGLPISFRCSTCERSGKLPDGRLERTPMRSRMLRIVPRVRHLGVLLLFCGAASLASAQWSWRDEHRRTVYSDQPPPASVRATDVLRQPASPPPTQPSDSNNAGAQSADNPAPPAPAPNAATPAATRPPTTAERELEFRKRLKERAESEKKAADA